MTGVWSLAAHYLLGWEVMPSWLAGVAMSTTSVAVVYAVMLEFGAITTPQLSQAGWPRRSSATVQEA
jgi:Kef-type K+ transport system membrane component KefB